MEKGRDLSLAAATTLVLLLSSCSGEITIPGQQLHHAEVDAGRGPLRDSALETTPTSVPMPDGGDAKAINDAGPEVCGDGLDNDGDGEVDEGCGCDPVNKPVQGCYSGPPATRGIGECTDGNQPCVKNGEFAAWGPCKGDVTPGVEDCIDGLDNDCNGKVDDGAGCLCKPGDTRPCYSGPANTEGVGECRAGAERCNAAGTGWEACQGEVLPVQEVCDDGKDNDCDALVDEGCKAVHQPLTCTTASMTHAVGSKDCGAHQAVYMMDDGVGPNFICCPLPADDILESAPAQIRWGQCSANEVITGAVAQYTFNCTAINTKRYTLASPKKPCYFGSGASGGQSVAKCPSHPTSFSVLQKSYFGSDGCSGYPYGSLFVRQTSKYCKEMLTVQLLYNGITGDPPPGTPVVMYAP
jgi:hypothetical protein